MLKSVLNRLCSQRSGKTVEEVWQLIHGAGGPRGPEPQTRLASVTLGSFLQSAGLGSLALDLPDVPELQVVPNPAVWRFSGVRLGSGAALRWTCPTCPELQVWCNPALRWCSAVGLGSRAAWRWTCAMCPSCRWCPERRVAFQWCPFRVWCSLALDLPDVPQAAGVVQSRPAVVQCCGLGSRAAWRWTCPTCPSCRLCPKRRVAFQWCPFRVWGSLALDLPDVPRAAGVVLSRPAVVQCCGFRVWGSLALDLPDVHELQVVPNLAVWRFSGVGSGSRAALRWTRLMCPEFEVRTSPAIWRCSATGLGFEASDALKLYVHAPAMWCVAVSCVA